ncbi:MAG: hypothetical protein JEZ07_02990 [Phycisphaerae bacterium]|nr:hypothetical protein [Phycisphaerae bacterium]
MSEEIFMIDKISSEWMMLSQRFDSKPLPKGADAGYNSVLGQFKRLSARSNVFMKRAENVLALDKDYCDLSDGKLREKALAFYELFRCRQDKEDDLERAFACIREVAFRQIGEKPFAVQIAGAFALDNGCVAEMATGEGKTLMSSMVGTLGGWRGKGCHVITVNDYLAKRDAQWMGKIYKFCGLTAKHIEQGMDHRARQEAYMADLTYCTNKEVAADFLRDRITLGQMKGLSSVLLKRIANGDDGFAGQVVQRGLNYAIVDEADSILIDEAVTPLIISGSKGNDQQVEIYRQGAELVGLLKVNEDYAINEKYKEIEITDAGKRKIANEAEGMGQFWKAVRRRNEMVHQGLVAREFFIKGKQYVLDDGKVVIVDEFTGRLMPDRSWREGLHQAIEAKENVEINPPKETFARISFQRFFRLYKKLSGMTGTAWEARGELWQIYKLPVVKIKTNRPCRREIRPGVVTADKQGKWQRIVDEVSEIHKTGRPVLVGTRSVKASEYLSEMLTGRGLRHEVLNAVNHKAEANIVAEAGQMSMITVATNMAGRGTDIKLGRGVADLGGLHVIVSELHESGRIDRQLLGRGARQGDPGSGQVIVSLEDELVQRNAGRLARYFSRGNSADSKVAFGLDLRLFKFSQRRAERHSHRRRKAVLKTDSWLDEQLGFAGKS